MNRYNQDLNRQPRRPKDRSNFGEMCIRDSSLVGMIFSITILRGRMSCCVARFKGIVNMPSCASVFAAGKLLLMLIGILHYPFPPY